MFADLADDDLVTNCTLLMLDKKVVQCILHLALQATLSLPHSIRTFSRMSSNLSRLGNCFQYNDILTLKPGR